MRTTFFYFFIFAMAGMLISSCEKDDDTSISGQQTQDDDSPASKFEGTTWYYESSVSTNGDTTKVEGTLAFLSNNKFTYSEEYVKKSPNINIDMADSIGGTYAYSGTPDIDSNLVFTYSSSSDVETTNYAKYFNNSITGEMIWLTLDGITRELAREESGSSDTSTTSGSLFDLENTTWKSDSFYDDQLKEDVYLDVFFKSAGECDITFQQSNGTMTSSNTYSVTGSTIYIDYKKLSNLQPATAEGIIVSENKIEMSDLYGKELTLTKQ